MAGGGDTIDVSDGVCGNDTVYGGPGTDSCDADVNDTLIDSENVTMSIRRPAARRG